MAKVSFTLEVSPLSPPGCAHTDTLLRYATKSTRILAKMKQERRQEKLTTDASGALSTQTAF